MTNPTVAIVGGTGELGHGLALRLAAAGLPVAIGSRKPEAAQTAAEAVLAAVPAAAVSAHVNADAVAAAEVVFVCVPFASQAATLRGLRAALRPGTVVVDCTVPLAASVGGRPTRMLGVWQGSAAEQARDLLPAEIALVSALHTVSGAKLADLARPLDQDVLVCGDDGAAKATVAALVERIGGLRAVDCGRLEQARIAESLTALLIGVNIRHKTTAGIRLTGLPERG
ncbi:NADPH-dependent F420 reductase [Conexibacter sp. JD483]|uniref:NADPH-dependent F420 reductase n=1 Tax=unclassified Conexibacter TaxID=2627773 RepID=UPI002719AACC|nr:MULTISPECIES: NADPH-dependent F420 reductase [unclassified Conexibacter]MDO8188746.1 NADPH-dependent F420 reductase [Conexibacter sp. CPCC 205706]MDO8199898.1 NADPH-dependent F420 reductase [Conexibacter sp. CPCC 205762]MDR9371159.1 NADPH-dependent F420 reductase [Conexibacter sp. JD483]